MIGPEGIDRTEAVSLVVGRVGGILAAQTDRPIAVVLFDQSADAPTRGISEASVPPPTVVPAVASDAVTEVATTVTLTSPELVAALAPTFAPAAGATAGTTPVNPAAPRPILKWPTPEEARALVTAKTAPSVIEAPRPPWGDKDDAFTTWRDRVKNPRAPTVEPLQSLWDDDATWRDRVVAWLTSGMQGPAPDARHSPRS